MSQSSKLKFHERFHYKIKSHVEADTFKLAFSQLISICNNMHFGATSFFHFLNDQNTNTLIDSQIECANFVYLSDIQTTKSSKLNYQSCPQKLLS